MGLIDDERDVKLKQAPNKIFEKVNLGFDKDYKYSRIKQIKRVLKFYGGAKWSPKVKGKIEELRMKILEENPLE